MNTSPTSSFVNRARAVGLALFLASAAFVNAGTLTDPALATGPGSIDPAGAATITVNASGSTAKATLEALDTFGVVQTFTGFVTGTNQISFTDPSRPDVQISISGSAGGGSVTTSAQFNTSGTSAVIFSSNNVTGAHTMNMTIDFGSWDGTAFDSAINAVSATGFTLNANAVRFDRVETISVAFMSADGLTALSTQSIAGSALVGSDQSIYFGYQATGGDSIGSINITVAVKANTGSQAQVILGLDDLGFTAAAIPEPATYAAIIGSLALGAVVWFRRK